MTKIIIKLNKEVYSPGEKVNGALEILSNGSLKAKNFKLLVSGVENTDIHKGENYSSSNIFFQQDLSHFLDTTNGSHYHNGTWELENGVKVIPFQFAIPPDALESYEGKYAKILYTINAKQAKNYFHMNINETLSFMIENVENSERSIPMRTVVSEAQNKNGISFKVEIEKDTFSPGGTIRGKLVINNTSKKKINGATLFLRGKEYAIGQEDVSAEIDFNGLSFKLPIKRKGKKSKEMVTVSECAKSYVELNDLDTVPFEIQIPEDVIRSYNGKVSNYSWILATKLDVHWDKDLHAESMIHIK